MFIFFSINVMTIVTILLFSIIAGAFALEKVIAILIGPIKWIAIIIFILSAIGSFIVSFLSARVSGNRLGTSFFGCILNAISTIIINSITIIFLLCFLTAYLQNMEAGGLINILWGVLVFFTDGILVLLALCASLVIECYAILLIDRIPIILVGMLHLVVAVLYFFVVQCMLSQPYEETVKIIFANQPQIAEFILRPWIISLMFG